jgi:hypothetical protein
MRNRVQSYYVALRSTSLSRSIDASLTGELLKCPASMKFHPT